MTYTVNRLARLAGVSPRTLRYYDQIGLLRPAGRGENGYRAYGEAEVARLQQILLHRELGFALEDIRVMLDRPGFDRLGALERHREALAARSARLDSLIRNVDKTIAYMKGERPMSDAEMFEGFDEETQRKYEDEAARRWGEKEVRESRRRWESYGRDKQQQIMAEAGENYRALVPFIGGDPTDPRVQSIIGRWHQNLRYFYEPTPQVLQGLGQAYSQDARFRAFYDRIDPRLADFLSEAIGVYAGSLGG